MPTISSIFLVLSLILAVVIGPQTRPWTWGPAMLALGVSVLAALPPIWRKDRRVDGPGIILLAFVAAGWFAWRALTSPVTEYGQADLLLLCSAIGAFIATRGITGDMKAERILVWGVALLLLANLIVIGFQIADPGYSPVFRTRAGPRMVSGFFAHYNETANYLIASSLLLGASALVGRHALPNRLIFGVLAAAGFAGVWFTHSRGGILGAATGSGVLAAMWLVIGGRRKTRWFGPAVVTVPIIAGIAIAAFILNGWENSQEARKANDTGVTGVLDNNCRLYFLGMALSCINKHPLAGGGSRSFSWECYEFADAKANGDTITHLPELVHNETIQAATDYGLIGAGLLAALLGTLMIACLLRLIFEKQPAEEDFRESWRIGGSAALAGMLVQSSFSFVFHLLPGIILLGICLAMMSRPDRGPAKGIKYASPLVLTVSALSCVVLLLANGLSGARVTRILWPTYFSKAGVPSDESQIDSLTEAIAIQPGSEFHQHRAQLLQKSALAESVRESGLLMERALADYRTIAELQPFDPNSMLNIATLLSRMNRHAEAEPFMDKAIALQGGMEPAFRARFLCAMHYFAKGIRDFSAERTGTALNSFERAAYEIELAVNAMHWVIEDMRQPRVAIHESLGVAREASGDPERALESYDFAASLHLGAKAHYRASVLLGRLAVERWHKRQSAEALYGFIEARKRLMKAGNELPQGVTPAERVEYLNYLDQSIEFLKGARIEPKEW